jgi:hypothetical protein
MEQNRAEMHFPLRCYRNPDVAVARFRQRAGELDPALKSGRKPLEAVRASVLHLSARGGRRHQGSPGETGDGCRGRRAGREG